ENHVGKNEKVVLGVAHGDNKSMLLEFKERIESTGLEVVKSIDTVVGSVIGTYAGPDCLLVFCYKP
ncbi:MAG: DegV family protein, partial [Actinomycetia bacterium]|nr:DegV family protein [Actinomycetes bacterium]